MAGSRTMEQLCFLFFLLLQVCSQVVVSYTTVNFLPGFHGPLPFHLETGYIGIGESEDVQLFYYFVKSQRNASEDPLLIWITGGPGCSALSGLVLEIGPFGFNKDEEFNGSTPSIVLNPYSWTKVSSIIFLDTPVGTGFSYAKTALASQSGDFLQIKQIDEFLRKWLTDHPEFQSNPVYVGGDSFSGITVPAMAKQFSVGNDEGFKPFINLKGHLVGNPATNLLTDGNSKIPFAHRMGLISDELYESLERSCKGEYQLIDPRNTECVKYMQDYSQCTTGINVVQILEPVCGYASPNPTEIAAERRSLTEHLQIMLDPQPWDPAVGCRNYAYLLLKYWADDSTVRKALGIKQGSIDGWTRCNYGLPYSHEIISSVEYHIYLGKKGYRALVYSGDHDMAMPYVGTQAWIKSLNYPIVEEWRPWHLGFQIAGYTRAYSNNLIFATVMGGGHTAPEYRPEECLAMYTRWLKDSTGGEEYNKLVLDILLDHW